MKRLIVSGLAVALLGAVATAEDQTTAVESTTVRSTELFEDHLACLSAGQFLLATPIVFSRVRSMIHVKRWSRDAVIQVYGYLKGNMWVKYSTYGNKQIPRLGRKPGVPRDDFQGFYDSCYKPVMTEWLDDDFHSTTDLIGNSIKDMSRFQVNLTALPDFLLNAALDPDMNWWPISNENDTIWSVNTASSIAQYHRAFRIVFLELTDIFFETGDATKYVEMYNEGPGTRENPKGGMGSSVIIDEVEKMGWTWAASADESNTHTNVENVTKSQYSLANYTIFSDLFYKEIEGSISAEEAVELARLKEAFGPLTTPTLKEHDGKLHIDDCSDYEHPTLEQVAEVYNKKRISVMIHISAEGSACSPELLAWCAANGHPNAICKGSLDIADTNKCIVDYYERKFSGAGFKNYYITSWYGNNQTAYTKSIMKNFMTFHNDNCRWEVDYVPPTTTEEPTTDAPTTDAPGTESAGTNTGGPIPPIAEEGGSSNVGVIAGATGGAVAGVAALGALAYKKVGFSMFGGGSGGPADVGTLEQVEVSNPTADRETMEQVTMEMFR